NKQQTCGNDENVRGKAVETSVWKIFSADPMNGRVEMSSSVFTGRKPIPVPRGAALVIARNFMKLKRRRIRPLRRQRQERRFGAQVGCEIHDFDLGVLYGANEIRQYRHMGFHPSLSHP